MSEEWDARQGDYHQLVLMRMVYVLYHFEHGVENEKKENGSRKRVSRE